MKMVMTPEMIVLTMTSIAVMMTDDDCDDEGNDEKAGDDGDVDDHGDGDRVDAVHLAGDALLWPTTRPEKLMKGRGI